MCKQKSFIYNWWIAPKDEKMRFVDIFRINVREFECVVVGEIDGPYWAIKSSNQRVVKITHRGVKTTNGIFYPFSIAHPLYLMYLNKFRFNNEMVIATNWKCVSGISELIAADLIFPTGEYLENVKFNFIPYENEPYFFYGFSSTLQMSVIINSFDKKPLMPKYKDVICIGDIHNTAFCFRNERRKLVKQVRKRKNVVICK